MIFPSKIRRALVICDMQADSMNSLFAKSKALNANACPSLKIPVGSEELSVDPLARRQAFYDSVKSVLCASVSSALHVDNALIIFSGLRFPSRYEGLHPNHCLYGSLRRLNEKIGDGPVHWFMEGYPGSEIDHGLFDMVSKPRRTNQVGVGGNVTSVKHEILWRSGHLPPSSLSLALAQNSISDVTVIGAKASQAVQSTVQHIAEHFPLIDVSVIQEALADDTEERLESIVENLLPLYARVASLEEYVEATCGLENYAVQIANEESVTDNAERRSKEETYGGSNVFYYSNCGRGGHFSVYVSHLQRRKSSPLKEGTSWFPYPTQKWYEDVFLSKQYYCPLGKKIVNFCDEPSFSKISMFLKGREWLDDKGNLFKLASDYLPETYVVKGCSKDYEYIGSGSTESDKIGHKHQEQTKLSHSGLTGPWFVKETNKNGGRAIQICHHLSQCLEQVNNPGESYVIQRHVPNPSLLRDGRKWHFKLYNLLICEEDALTWTLRCHEEAFICCASKPWTPDDLTPEAQLTIKRTMRFRPDTSAKKTIFPIPADEYPGMFQKCTIAVSSVIKRAIDSNNLQGRQGKKQFELFSADFLFDANVDKAYLIEFNFSPVLYDPYIDQELTTPGMKAYHDLFLKYGADAEVNDHLMIGDVVSIVFSTDETVKKANCAETIGGWKVVQLSTGASPRKKC